MGKYLTVINTKTYESVPFLLLKTGEISLNSTNKFDTEENCKVVLTDVFYEHSLDYYLVKDWLEWQK